ncbi:serine kinase [Kaistia defluvii]|uniref:serine kinase n=1 Tax=Kaistia defluvii TaxID=410841 RepID=UPI002258392D|nr:serine kinase [Kaistia defluvii]MCX5517854.1 serine kinase [Kaistia defluvii]
METKADQGAGVDRCNLVDWMRQVIRELEATPRALFTTHRITPAGLNIETHFDDPDFAAAYAGRLRDVEVEGMPADRLYVLTGKAAAFQAVPAWRDAEFPPPAFHAMIRAAGLRAAYPFQARVWRFFDPRSRVGVQWTASPDDLPPWEGSAPLRQHLHWLLDESGLRLAHAATLGWRDRGVVLFGKGGAGKSGTTLAGLAAGLSTVGDDYVALAGSPGPVARPLYRVLKQDRAGLARTPELDAKTAHLVDNWRGKVEFDPDQFFRGATVDKMDLRAAILPRIAHASRPAIVAARPQALMLALMSSNLHQFAGEADDGMSFFARLLACLPCFEMELSDDAAANGRVLRDFIAALPAQFDARELVS